MLSFIASYTELLSHWMLRYTSILSLLKKYKIAQRTDGATKEQHYCKHIPSVPLGVMELLLMWELSRLGPLGDSLLPLTRLWGLARSCISIDLTRHKQQIKLHISLWFQRRKTHSSYMQCTVHNIT